MPKQIICSNCGASERYNLYGSQSTVARMMRLKSLCFDCAYWQDYYEHPQQDTYIISGKLYTFYPIETIIRHKQKRKKRGLVFARNMQTGKIVYASRYQYIASVPENFKHLFPDQFRFISEPTYAILASRICRECLAKGCWDRYYCFWYNKEKAEPHIPWNTIPPSHKPGDEQCESFINKETMYNVNIQENEDF